MTLLKQIYIGVSLIFLVALMGIEYAVVINSNTHHQRQLVSSAQEAATALSISLAQALQTDDRLLANTIVSAVFESGHYLSIQVISTTGQILIEKRLPPNPPTVPHWFTNVATLNPSTEESLITSGWRQLGRVLVTSHPNFAYLRLWQISWVLLLWLTVLSAVSLLLLHRFLCRILNPLKEIEAVANAISKHDFQQVKQTPKARELRSVIGAMNSLSEKIRKSIDYEIGRANLYRHKAYSDKLTAIPNRLSFDEGLSARLVDDADAPSGVVILIALINRHLNDFTETDDTTNSRGDELLRYTGGVIADFCRQRQTQFAALHARLGGATFGVAFFKLTQIEAGELCAALGATINQAIHERGPSPHVKFSCGGAYFEAPSSVRSLLARADMAMLQSRAFNGDKAVLLAEGDSAGDNKGWRYWQKLIHDRLIDNKISLHAQPVKRLTDQRLFQLELLGKLEDDKGELLNAEQFMPMAIRGDAAAQIDRRLIEKAMGIAKLDPSVDIAINLSICSVRDREFSNWLVNSMASVRADSARFFFEISEYSISDDAKAAADSRWLCHVSEVKQFVTSLRRTGARFGIDDFGLHRQSFDYLQQLKPDYIKLNISLIGDIANNIENQLFISSIVKICGALDVLTIVSGVETEDLLPLLGNLGVYGYQGGASGEPAKIDVGIANS
jgi:EAL domain-containing protein (putative c-di-GMP-specific phosphodiesterase class I)/GGDEF domain-containing protein